MPQDRTLPHSKDAEDAIVGGLQINPHLVNEVFAVLDEDDFYLPFNRRAIKAIRQLVRDGRKVDPILIVEVMTRDGEIKGGKSALMKLTEGLPRFTTLEQYIDIVRTKSLARRLIKFCGEMSENILEEDMDAPRHLDGMITSLVEFQSRTGRKIVSAGEVAGNVKSMFESWARGESEQSGLKTGIPELDRQLRMHGLAKREHTFIAARPSTGKTAIVLQIIGNLIRLGVPVYFNSLEMGFEQIMTRMLAARTGIANRSINPYTLKNGVWEREALYEALEEMNLPLYFDRAPLYEQSLATAEHLIKTRGVQVVAYDYLQMFGTHDGLERTNPNRAYGLVTRGFKQLALQHNVAALGIGQFSREVEKEMRRPRMSDNRDSGEIEQAVDTMLFPWDPRAKENRKNPEAVKDKIWLDLYCEKQRDGGRYWTVPVLYDKNKQTFESPEMGAGEPPRRVEFANVEVSKPQTNGYKDFTEPKSAEDED